MCYHSVTLLCWAYSRRKAFTFLVKRNATDETTKQHYTLCISHLHMLNNLCRGNKLSVHKPESFACWEAASQDGRPTLLPTFFIGSISLGHGASPGETIVSPYTHFVEQIGCALWEGGEKCCCGLWLRGWGKGVMLELTGGTLGGAAMVMVGDEQRGAPKEGRTVGIGRGPRRTRGRGERPTFIYNCFSWKTLRRNLRIILV